MVGGSPPAWRSRSVPRVVNSRASAMVCATNGGPGVVEARQQQDAMARSDRVLQKNIEREQESRGFGPIWPATTGLQTALRTKNSRLSWERAYGKLAMASSSAVSTRSSMGKPAPGTGSGLQEGVWLILLGEW